MAHDSNRSWRSPPDWDQSLGKSQANRHQTTWNSIRTIDLWFFSLQTLLERNSGLCACEPKLRCNGLILCWLVGNRRSRQNIWLSSVDSKVVDKEREKNMNRKHHCPSILKSINIRMSVFFCSRKTSRHRHAHMLWNDRRALPALGLFWCSFQLLLSTLDECQRQWPTSFECIEPCLFEFHSTLDCYPMLTRLILSE